MKVDSVLGKLRDRGCELGSWRPCREVGDLKRPGRAVRVDRWLQLAPFSASGGINMAQPVWALVVPARVERFCEGVDELADFIREVAPPAL